VSAHDLVQFEILRVKSTNTDPREINLIQTVRISYQYKITIKAGIVKKLELRAGDLVDIEYIQKIEKPE